MSSNKKMIQYSVWSNCNNNCKFCLRKERIFYSLEEQLASLEAISENIKQLDWEQYPYGVSLLGGEIFNISDDRLKSKFYDLVDVIIKNVLANPKLQTPKFSSVTNGIYDPEFLFNVVDKIKAEAGIDKVDINFSYDLKYRYKSEDDRKLVLENINKFHERYDYRVGIQMILTEYLIEMVKSGQFNIKSFLANDVPGCMLAFLYPHAISTGIVLDDFQFTRDNFLWFLNFLRNEDYGTYLNFVYSTRNSSTFKYTGLKDKSNKLHMNVNQVPVLSDGKEIINPVCGHSQLYQCYSDTDRCMMCDILAFDNTIYS